MFYTTLALSALSLLSTFQNVEAGPRGKFMGKKMRQHRLWAEKGVLPDGTPMEHLGKHGPKNLMNHGFFPASGNGTNQTEVIKEETVTLPLDHFGYTPSHTKNSTFKNRYWVSESSYQPGGPVFICDIGEANAEDYVAYYLADTTSACRTITDQFGGIAIVWEHRFYGKSTPVPVSNTMDFNYLQYLTVEQALADVASFAAQFTRTDLPNIDLSPSSTPWVFLGASYPGIRAALMREFYPETIFASYASSAPVEARVDMGVYYDPIWQGMVSDGWGNCSADIHAAIVEMDKQLEDPIKASALKKKFLGAGGQNNSNGDFADALDAIFLQWQSYQFSNGFGSLRQFCNYLETDSSLGGSNKTAPIEGLAAHLGAQYVIDKWASWPNFAPLINYYYGTSCGGQNATSASFCDLGGVISDPDSISWAWQYCTQWGFFQKSNGPGPKQIVSKFNTINEWIGNCHSQFPGAAFLPPIPAVDALNKKTGGWDIRPSNTFFTEGEFDPWRSLSELSAQPFAPKPMLTQVIPSCNATTPQGQLFGYLIKDGVHAGDWQVGWPEGDKARNYFTTALSQWLKCFPGFGNSSKKGN